MVRCAQCQKEFDQPGTKDGVASISGCIRGDEYIESYFLCAECGVYTVEIYQDRFSGQEGVSVRGPAPKSEGDAKVELIMQCPEPWKKHCRCPAHQAYFGGSLD
jgi:hypothetical protein